MNKKMLVMGCAAVVLAAHADTNETVSVDEIIGETVKVFQEQGWTAKDVADAVKSLRGLYLRDTSTQSGRSRWHGKVVSESVDTNRLVRVTVYEDGETFEDAAHIVTAEESVRKANAQIKKAVSVTTNGVPAALAAARLRRQDAINQGESNVTVTVTAGQN